MLNTPKSAMAAASDAATARAKITKVIPYAHTEEKIHCDGELLNSMTKFMTQTNDEQQASSDAALPIQSTEQAAQVFLIPLTFYLWPCMLSHSHSHLVPGGKAQSLL